jgi:hypothetical protein
MAKTPVKRKARSGSEHGLTSLSVCGFKSLVGTCTIEVRELTVLAGANSSGKSSIMQPFLLLKQTLDAPYDPGPLRLDGDNVRFSSVGQFLPLRTGCGSDGALVISTTIGDDTLSLSFRPGTDHVLDLCEMAYSEPGQHTVLRPSMDPKQARATIGAFAEAFESIFTRTKTKGQFKPEWVVQRSRCFLELLLRDVGQPANGIRPPFPVPLADSFEMELRRIIHVPGLRGNPVRVYRTTAVGPDFAGTFENYVASVVYRWQQTKDTRLQGLGGDLRALGLTWKVQAKPVDDTQVELRVGRLPQAVRGGAADLVSVADVGFGVSQVLPVLVALRVAEPGRLVYIEQPEIHLHPKAQVALAEVLAQAAQRGVRVVVETHSDLLLVSLQRLVAEGRLEPEKVKLHWFQREADGSTKVASHDMDEAGAFGDWPVDFGEVAMATEGAYLDAAEARLAEGGGA